MDPTDVFHADLMYNKQMRYVNIVHRCSQYLIKTDLSFTALMEASDIL